MMNEHEKAILKLQKARGELIAKQLDRAESDAFFWRCTSVVLVLIAIVGFAL